MSDLSLLYTELVVPRCSLTYGSAPCAAAVGSTGDFKCYNTPATCQDPANYSEDAEEHVIRWVQSTDYAPPDIDAAPILESVSVSAQRINPGEDLGKRERITATYENGPSNDFGLDPYPESRDFNPWERGSYWGKFAARYPNIQGYEFRKIHGFVGESLAEMETSYYVAEEGKQTSDNSGYEISARDVLTFMEGNKSLCPAPSNGILSLGIDTSLNPFDLEPAGIGVNYGDELDGEGAPKVHYASIGDEFFSYTRSGDTLTPVARGLRGTEAAEHDAGETVQVAAVFESLDAADLFEALLGYTDTPAEYYNKPQWKEEVAEFSTRRYTGIVAEPTEVHKLVGELMKDLGLEVWSDIVNKKIIMRYIRPQDASFSLTDDVLSDLRPSILTDKRISAFYIRYARVNPLEKLDEPKNYTGRLLSVNGDDRAVLQRNAPSIRSHFSRWIPPTLRSAASDAAGLMIDRYGQAPRALSATVPVRFSPALGDVGEVQTRVFENPQGEMEILTMQVVQLAKGRGNNSILLEEHKAEELEDDGVREVSLIESWNNMGEFSSLRSIYNADYGSAEIPAGTIVRFVADTGIVFGSQSVGEFAVEAGEWPETENGVTIEIVGLVIAGRGGVGGGAGLDGGYGGPALYTRVPLTLKGCDIGGGGGGGAGDTFTSGGGTIYDARGGGGAGRIPGSGYENGTTFTGGSGENNEEQAIGGSGGNLGESGQGSSTASGGAPGLAIDGYSYITLEDSTVYGLTQN